MYLLLHPMLPDELLWKPVKGRRKPDLPVYNGQEHREEMSCSQFAVYILRISGDALAIDPKGHQWLVQVLWLSIVSICHCIEPHRAALVCIVKHLTDGTIGLSLILCTPGSST